MADNSKQKDKLIYDLDMHVSRIEKALASMKKSIDELQVGNGKFPYWNGTNACNVLKTSLTQYQTDVGLLINIAECKSKIKK